MEALYKRISSSHSVRIKKKKEKKKKGERDE